MSSGDPTVIEAPAASGPIGFRSQAVALEGVDRTYATRRGEVAALAGLSLRADAGEVVAVVGPSGCGKTTLLELVCGLQRPDGGTVRCEPAALMPQSDLLLPWATALDNAGLALRCAGASRSEARAAGRAVVSPPRTRRL